MWYGLYSVRECVLRKPYKCAAGFIDLTACGSQVLIRDYFLQLKQYQRQRNSQSGSRNESPGMESEISSRSSSIADCAELKSHTSVTIPDANHLSDGIQGNANSHQKPSTIGLPQNDADLPVTDEVIAEDVMKIMSTAKNLQNLALGFSHPSAGAGKKCFFFLR